MRAGLEQAAASFESEAQAMLEFFKNKAPESSKAWSTGAALEELERLKERLEINRETERNLKTGMQVFDQILEHNEKISDLEAGIGILSELWRMKSEWDTIWDAYKLGKFADLNTETMEETASKFMKKVMMKRKEAGSRPLWSELKLAVDRFRATMPLITDLRNKDLRERHWNSLMDQVGTRFDYEGDDFTLDRVIGLGLISMPST
jgi:dynein heavy chain